MTIARAARWRVRISIIAAAALWPAAVQAQSMDVATFLVKAEALQKRGPVALLSKDFRRLKNEMMGAGKILKAEREAAVRVGRAPDYCPPGKASIGSNELLSHLRAVPPARRGMKVTEALRGFMRKKYPCPA